MAESYDDDFDAAEISPPEKKRKAKKKEMSVEKESKQSVARSRAAPAEKSAKLSLGGLQAEAAQRTEVKQFFQQVDTTQEYAETNYWKIRNHVDYSTLVRFQFKASLGFSRLTDFV